MASVSQTAAGNRSRREKRKPSPPAALSVLAERFDIDVMDVPSQPARIRLEVRPTRSANGQPPARWDAVIAESGMRLEPAREGTGPDALLSADAAAWRRVAKDVRGGMDAFRAGRLQVRRNLHLGVGFLAASSAIDEPRRLRFDSIETSEGRLSVLAAGVGEPVLCIHGLGGTKASFLPTVSALAEHHRVIALDLPGFGESEKPLTGAYDAPHFARAVEALLDALELDRAHLVGNSMGGRVAIEAGLAYPDRIGRLILLSPALAWLRERRWKWLLQPPVPKLGLIQPAPRAIVEPLIRRLVPGGEHGWAAAGVDEFLRAFCDPRGRAAFYSAARNIYVDEPHGEEGLWTRLAELSPETMFIWGRHDGLVPIAFMKHVERVLPAARHVELDCGHVPQIESPEETHAAIRRFLAQRRPR